MHYNLDEFEAAIRFYKRALRISSERANIASLLSKIGEICKKIGSSKSALSYLSKANEIYEEMGTCGEVMGKNLSLMSECYDDEGDYEREIKCLNKSLRIYYSVYDENHKIILDILNRIKKSKLYLIKKKFNIDTILPFCFGILFNDTNFL